jgi:PPK2 family polyphosphate:nucleotide phosphotransferase
MKLRERFLVQPGVKVKLARFDPGDRAGIDKKKQTLADLEDRRKKLYELQYLLHAEKKRSLLIVLQAMDAGGKDGTIRHVMSGLNPQGCHVTSFKVPTEEELAHDYLWRVHRAVPAKGEIGIFNRSHYGDVLVVRVHNLVPRRVWSERYEQINGFEKILADNDVTIVKFFLHISKEEQKLISRNADSGPTTSRPMKMRSASAAHPGRPGTSFPRTTSGSATWPWPTFS